MDDDKLTPKPGIEEVREAVKILDDFSFISQIGKAILKALKDINCSIDKDEIFNKKQTFISDFFSKKQILKSE